MNRISHNEMFNKISKDLATVSLNDRKTHLWNDKMDPEADKQVLEDLSNEFFTASLDQGTTTGVLREHIMRMNSSVNCGRINRSDFPSTCTGENPFQVSYSHGGNFTRVCVPGAFGTSPWNLTRNRQDLTEELFLDVLEEVAVIKGALVKEELTSNYTLHCTSTTTRGYFELGNYRNNYTWGPLLEQWPSQEVLRTEYNDMVKARFSSPAMIPSEV